MTTKPESGSPNRNIIKNADGEYVATDELLRKLAVDDNEPAGAPPVSGITVMAQEILRHRDALKTVSWTGVEIAPHALLCDLAANAKSPYRLMAQELLYLRHQGRTDKNMIATVFQSALGRALEAIGVLRSTTSEQWKTLCASVDSAAESLACTLTPLIPRRIEVDDFTRGWNAALDEMLKSERTTGVRPPPSGFVALSPSQATDPAIDPTIRALLAERIRNGVTRAVTATLDEYEPCLPGEEYSSATLAVGHKIAARAAEILTDELTIDLLISAAPSTGADHPGRWNSDLDEMERSVTGATASAVLKDVEDVQS